VEDAHPAPSAAGLRKPSPGFILRADGSLVALNNAHIEVRASPPLPQPHHTLSSAVFPAFWYRDEAGRRRMRVLARRCMRGRPRAPNTPSSVFLRHPRGAPARHAPSSSFRFDDIYKRRESVHKSVFCKTAHIFQKTPVERRGRRAPLSPTDTSVLAPACCPVGTAFQSHGSAFRLDAPPSPAVTLLWVKGSMCQIRSHLSKLHLFVKRLSKT
jgi:hypothetical protein